MVWEDSSCAGSPLDVHKDWSVHRFGQASTNSTSPWAKMNSRPRSSKVSSNADENRTLWISGSASRSNLIALSVPGAAPQARHAPERSSTRSSPPDVVAHEVTRIPPPCPSNAARTSPSLASKAGTIRSPPISDSRRRLRRMASSAGSMSSARRRAASSAIAAAASAAYRATRSSSMEHSSRRGS